MRCALKRSGFGRISSWYFCVGLLLWRVGAVGLDLRGLFL